MKLMKRAASLLLVAIMITVLCPGAFADEPYEDARNSVVRILTKVDGQYMTTGSGFFIGTEGSSVQYIVTNSHVIHFEDEEYIYTPDSLDVIFDGVNDQTTLEATVVKDWEYWVEGQPDLAILRLTTETTLREPLTLMSSSELELTQTIYALGFPAISDYNFYDMPSRAEDVSVTKGEVTKQLYQGINGDAKYFQMDVSISGGNSGGPVITEDGYVVGISSYGSTVAAGFNYALYTDYVMEFLTTMGIEYDSVTAREAAARRHAPSVWAVALIVVVVVAAGGAVLYFTVLKKKNKRPQMPNHMPNQMQNHPPVGAPNASGMPPAQPSVAGISGVMTGRVFPVTGALIFGRDPARCSVAFSTDTPGVSAVHCIVKPDAGGGITIADQGSTYGTFLEGGTKLTPNQEYKLSKGMKFYLASQGNGFIVN